MKKLMSIVEVQGEGLEALLGKKVLIFCAVYIYHGTLAGVNEKCILVEDCSIVYETGAFTDKKLKEISLLILV